MAEADIRFSVMVQAAMFCLILSQLGKRFADTCKIFLVLCELGSFTVDDGGGSLGDKALVGELLLQTLDLAIQLLFKMCHRLFLQDFLADDIK